MEKTRKFVRRMRKTVGTLEPSAIKNGEKSNDHNPQTHHRRVDNHAYRVHTLLAYRGWIARGSLLLCCSCDRVQRCLNRMRLRGRTARTFAGNVRYGLAREIILAGLASLSDQGRYPLV